MNASGVLIEGLFDFGGFFWGVSFLVLASETSYSELDEQRGVQSPKQNAIVF